MVSTGVLYRSVILKRYLECILDSMQRTSIELYTNMENYQRQLKVIILQICDRQY
jgi:hypothetical protein